MSDSLNLRLKVPVLSSRVEPRDLTLSLALLFSLSPLLLTNDSYRTGVNLTVTMVWILTGVVLWMGCRNRSSILGAIGRSPLMVLYCLLIILSDVLTRLVEPDLGFSGFEHAIGYSVIGLLCFFLFPSVIAEYPARTFLITLVVVGVFFSLVSIFVAVTGATSVLGFGISIMRRFGDTGFFFNGSLFGKAGRFGFTAYAGALAAWYLFVRGVNRSDRYLALAGCLICTAGVLISSTRTTYGALVITPMIWAFSGRRLFGKVILSATVLVLVSALVYVTFTEDSLYSVTFGEGLARRELLWPAAVVSIQDRPLLGYGFGRSDVIMREIYEETGYEKVIHSTPLSLAFRGGLPLALLYLAIIVFSAYRLLRSRWGSAEKAFLLSGVTASFMAAFFLDYTPGGVSYATVVQTIFLGLANISIWTDHPWVPEASWTEVHLHPQPSRNRIQDRGLV